MSAYQPPTQSPAPTSRPGTATAGAIIAIALTSLSLLGATLGFIFALSASSTSADFTTSGERAAVVTFLGIAVALCAVGLFAAIKALRNSNAWRITTVVFGFTVAVFALIGAIANFVEKHNCYNDAYNSCSSNAGNIAGGVFGLIWAALACAAAVLLLINGANAFYSGAGTPEYSPTPTAYQAFGAPSASVPAAQSAPAGWYPVDGGKLRWWDGLAWSEHFHDGQ